MPLHDDIVGVVLAGGASSRMGSDKSLISFGGVPLISYAAHTLVSVFRDVMISSGNSPRYSFLGLPEILDDFEDSGPLGGIHACLKEANGRAIFVLACDLPFVTTGLVDHMLSDNRNSRITIVADAVDTQPLCGHYPASILPYVERLLIQGRRGVFKALEGIDHEIVHIGSRHRFYRPYALQNINTPDDITTFFRRAFDNQ